MRIHKGHQLVKFFIPTQLTWKSESHWKSCWFMIKYLPLHQAPFIHLNHLTYLKSRLANFPFGFEVLGKRFDARKELFHCNQNIKIYNCLCASIYLSNQNCGLYLHVGSLLMWFRIRFTTSDYDMCWIKFLH